MNNTTHLWCAAAAAGGAARGSRPLEHPELRAASSFIIDEARYCMVLEDGAAINAAGAAAAAAFLWLVALL
jgi:hypothetical protein